ncbi:MAG: hypothetical protein WCO03_01950 [bacterium]
MFKKIILAGVLGLVISIGFLSPLSVKAQVLDRVAIRAEIRSLLTELRGLRDRLDIFLAKLRGGDTGVDQSQLTQSIQQTQNLFQTISGGLNNGDRGDDILA